MNATVRTMLDLQESDREIHRLRRESQAKPAALAREEAATKEAERELEALRTEIRELQKQVDQRNVDLRAAEEAIRKLDAQAQTLKTNAEYQAMQKQIGGKKADISLLEDRILEGMEQVEKARSGLPAKEAAAKQHQRVLAEAKERVAREMAEVARQLVAAEAEWTRRAALVSSDILPTYRLLRDRHGPSAVAELTPEGTCQGCYMNVTTHKLNTVMSGNLTQCNSCERFLFLRIR